MVRFKLQPLYTTRKSFGVSSIGDWADPVKF
jgi:hypothetical protein